MPAGVVNLVLGPGERVGQALADSPDVDLVSLTGGLEAGRALLRGAAVNVKRVALELGGKSPNIVFADADFETAVDNALTAAFTHSGQVCSAGCRAIVQDDDLRRASSRSSAGAPTGSGSGTASTTRPRPARSSRAAHRAKVEAHVAAGHRRGGAAGRRRPATRRARAAGRLLLPADGLRRRHAGTCGSSARRSSARSSPSSGSRPRTRPSRSATTPPTAWPARSGPPTPGAPSGSPRGCATGPSGSTTTTPTCRRPSGAASSSPGIGRELGPSGLDEYREAKHIWQNTRPGPSGWFGG